jgi:thymidylate kinase
MKKHETPFRFSVTGIDGSGKDSVTKSVLEMLSVGGTAIEVGKPSRRYNNGDSIEIFRPIVRPIDAVHNFGDRHELQKLVLGISAVNTLTKSRVLERLAVLYRPDIIASNRDARIDSAVYLEYYNNDRLQAMSIDERIARLQRLTKISRDLIIRLAVDPEVALQRIENGLADSDSQRAVRQMHETIDGLSRLDTAYEPASRALMAIQPHRAATVDVSDRTQAEVLNVVYSVITAARNDDIRPGEHVVI